MAFTDKKSIHEFLELQVDNKLNIIKKKIWSKKKVHYYL